MAELLTAAQMRALEAAAIASGAVTGLELMERAGRGVVEAIFEEWPELAAGTFRAVVLCGPGNNGGDGFVVARLLKEWGWEVAVFLYGDPAKLPPDAKANYERWRGMGVVEPLLDSDDPHHPWGKHLIVDALFGTGLTRPLDFAPGPMLPEWDLRGEPGRPRVVAIDIPSGLCADSGRVLGDAAFRADLTVTFHRHKAGHHLGVGPEHCGRLHLCDIGLPQPPRIPTAAPAGPGWVLYPPGMIRAEPVPDACRLITAPDGLAKTSGHKYSHGHALILSGGPGRGGAGRLAARGALRIGAGVVTLACPPRAVAENAARLDAVMLRGVKDAAALGQVLADRRINALCLGPGLGTGAREAGLLALALGAEAAVRGEHAPYRVRGCVLDADALTLLAREPALFAALHGGCVLTPHGGEFARLFPDLAEKLAAPAARGPAYSKVDAAREAAGRAGCVVLFKGADTVIADPLGRCSINAAQYERAAPWLATAGAGDVLAGFIAGLLARGFDPFEAACAGAWLHVECARSFGPGLIAEDLPEELPKVFRGLGM